MKDIVMTNFYEDYDRLTNGAFSGAVCVVGVGHDNSENIFRDNPQVFLLKDKTDFSFEGVEVLLDGFKDTFVFLGVELALIDWFRLEESIRRMYQIFNKEIRCI